MAKPMSRHEFFEQVKRDHEELRDLLGQLHKLIEQHQTLEGDVGELVPSLITHLETHFQEEEEAGLFRQIVEEAPRLAERIEPLRQQHAQLLAKARELAGRLVQGASTDAAVWQQIADEFQHFSQQLMEHESREHELLQQAFDDDIGSQD